VTRDQEVKGVKRVNRVLVELMEHVEKWVFPETKGIRETEDQRERKDQPVPREMLVLVV